MSQDYQTRQPTIEEDNLSRPIRTGHNQHTHIGNTRQPELQLKSSSCSSVIPGHNSRYVIPSHNWRNTTCFNPYPEPQLKEHQQSHLWSITKSLIDHAYRINNPRLQQQNRLAGDTYRQVLPASRPPSGGHVPQGTKRLKNSQCCRHRLAEPPSLPRAWVLDAHWCSWYRLAESSLPPSATLFQSPLFCVCRLAGRSPSPGATPVPAQYWLLVQIIAHLCTCCSRLPSSQCTPNIRLALYNIPDLIVPHLYIHPLSHIDNLKHSHL